MKTPVFQGCCTALISPFTDDGLDLARLGEIIRLQDESGVAAILAAGTTGESATLDIHEYEQLVDFCVQHAAGRMKVLAAAGGNNTESCLTRAKIAEALGADAVLITVPYYNKSTPKGRIEHFVYVADRIGIPLIVYNVPSRTVVGCTVSDYRELAKHPNINGVKEASGDLTLCARTAAACGDAFFLWSGNDDITVPMMTLGAQGVISVASNLVPRTVARLCSLCFEGNYQAAARLYFRYAELFEDLFLETNPIPVKAALRLMGLDSGRLRRPLTEMSEEPLARLTRCMQGLELLEE